VTLDIDVILEVPDETDRQRHLAAFKKETTGIEVNFLLFKIILFQRLSVTRI
jgi:hypothetical protein